MKLTAMVAMDEASGIGKAGKLPWRFAEDLKRFKAKTMAHPMILGRKTWDSLGGKPLPGRPHIVLTRTPEALEEARAKAPESAPVHPVGSIVEALMWADVYALEPFIIGGAEVYHAFSRYIHVWEITRIPGTWGCDTFLDLSDDYLSTLSLEKEEKEGQLLFQTWSRTPR